MRPIFNVLWFALLLTIFFTTALNAKNLTAAPAVNWSNLSGEEMENLIRKEMKLAQQKMGLEKTDAIFELLKYEPYVLDNPKLTADIFYGVANRLAYHQAHLIAAEYYKLMLHHRDRYESASDHSGQIGNLGWQFHMAGFPDSALYYMKLATAGPDKNDTDSEFTFAPHFNNLGMLFQEMRSDSAQHYFLLAIKHLENPSDILLTNIRDNLAEYHTQRGDYEKALAIHQLNNSFLKNVALDENVDMQKIQWRTFKANLGICKNLIYLNRLSQAALFLKNTRVLFDSAEHENKKKGFRKEFLDLNLLYAERKGDIKMKTIYQDSLLQLQNLEETEYRAANKIAMNTLFNLKLTKFDKELELQLAINQRKEQQLENARLHTYLFIALAIAALLAAILFFQKRIAHQKEELLLKKKKVQAIQHQLVRGDEERKQLQQSLHQTERDLLDFSTYINDNRTWTNQIVQELEKLVDSKTVVPLEIHQLLKDLKNRQQLDEKMKLLVDNIDKINHMFYDKLAEKFPTLTDSEKELCGLFRLNLSNKDIAIFRNVSPDSLKMSKYRLRKKLQLSSDVKLFNYLNSLDIQ